MARATALRAEGRGLLKSDQLKGLHEALDPKED